MTLTPIEKLEKLVEENVRFKLESTYVGVYWNIDTTTYEIKNGRVSKTMGQAITALYEAAQKAYPGRLG